MLCYVLLIARSASGREGWVAQRLGGGPRGEVERELDLVCLPVGGRQGEDPRDGLLHRVVLEDREDGGLVGRDLGRELVRQLGPDRQATPESIALNGQDATMGDDPGHDANHHQKTTSW